MTRSSPSRLRLRPAPGIGDGGQRRSAAEGTTTP
ncbi:hypothetical protein DFP74_2812 [Nocardiopsis sp. Huas11]|nr:hypothetical protein DFP74_2812 [Nocardiopsis sp. Huas11]